MKGIYKNARLCVTRLRQNAHLPNVNSAFVAGASLDFDVFRDSLNILPRAQALVPEFLDAPFKNKCFRRSGKTGPDSAEINLPPPILSTA
jgi:hypothetical protein